MVFRAATAAGIVVVLVALPFTLAGTDVAFGVVAFVLGLWGLYGLARDMTAVHRRRREGDDRLSLSGVQRRQR